jgi:hypothetical protein
MDTYADILATNHVDNVIGHVDTFSFYEEDDLSFNTWYFSLETDIHFTESSTEEEVLAYIKQNPEKCKVKNFFKGSDSPGFSLFD